jgi:hypothetical protein
MAKSCGDHWIYGEINDQGLFVDFIVCNRGRQEADAKSVQ